MFKSPDPLIIITGAAGFIGCNVVKDLNERGFKNLVLVDLYKDDQNLGFANWHTFLTKEELFPWLEGRQDEIAAFIHLGACSDTLESDREYLMQNNFAFTVQLAEYALKHQKRFIYASSAATYGDGRRGFSDDHDQLENLQPLNLYGLSKHLFDLWCKKENILDKVVGLKYFNVFGPHEAHKGRMASMVYKMVPIAQKEGVIRLFKSTEPSLFADGEQKRDFIYVKDVARLTVDFLYDDLAGIFNMGRGEPFSWNRLAAAIFNALGKPSCIEYIDMPDELKAQYQNYTCADMTKFLQTKKTPFHYTVEEGVSDYVRNYLVKGTVHGQTHRDVQQV